MGTQVYGLALEVVSGALTKLSGGDGDIYTKDGRKTRVYLAVKDLRWSDPYSPTGGLRGKVVYTVTELVTNNTCLSWTGTISADLPEHVWKALESDPSIIPAYERTWEVLGKQLGELVVPDTAGSIIDKGTYRIDGAGEDYTNAQVKLSLFLPVFYRVG